MANREEWEKEYREEMNAGMKEARWTGINFLIRVVLPIGIVGVLVFAGLNTVGIIGQGGSVLQKTFNADNAIANYEWFKRQANGLVAAEQRIQITNDAMADFKESAGERSDWTFEDKEEYSRLSTDLRGQKAHFEQLKADFRAKSSMVNRSIFKGDDEVIRWADQLTELE